MRPRLSPDTLRRQQYRVVPSEGTDLANRPSLSNHIVGPFAEYVAMDIAIKSLLGRTCRGGCMQRKYQPILLSAHIIIVGKFWRGQDGHGPDPQPRALQYSLNAPRCARSRSPCPQFCKELPISSP